MSRYDVFITHASEDKDSLVQPLADALAALGVDVGHDAFALEAGESPSRNGDPGAGGSRFELVVLSQSLVRKPWSEGELRKLISQEPGRGTVIPVWFGLSRDEVLAFSPSLADRFAIDASSAAVDEVAAEILRVVRPDRYEQLVKDRSCRRRSKHDSLSRALTVRISLIRHTFIDVIPDSLEQVMSRFRRDGNPEKEVAVWEAMAAVYLDFKQMFKPDPSRCPEAFLLILELSMGRLRLRTPGESKALTPEEFKFLYARWEALGPYAAVDVKQLH